MSAPKGLSLVLLIAVYACLNTASGLRLPFKFNFEPTSCCKTVINRPLKNVIEYHSLKADPPCLEAVIFTTERGRHVCSDPKAPWVKKMMEALDKKKGRALLRG